jgi:hypothetical protein
MAYSSADLSFEWIGEGRRQTRRPKGGGVTTSQDAAPRRDFLLKRAVSIFVRFVSEKHYSCYSPF